MKTPKIYIGALAVFCIAALIIGSYGAAAMTQQGTGNNLKVKAGQFGPEKMLDNLTAQGYDVSAIRTALSTRDYKTVQILLQEFRTEHPNASPHSVKETAAVTWAGRGGHRLTNNLSEPRNVSTSQYFLFTMCRHPAKIRNLSEIWQHTI